MMVRNDSKRPSKFLSLVRKFMLPTIENTKVIIANRMKKLRKSF